MKSPLIVIVVSLSFIILCGCSDLISAGLTADCKEKYELGDYKGVITDCDKALRFDTENKSAYACCPFSVAFSSVIIPC